MITFSIFMNKAYSFPIDSILLIGPTGVGKSPLGDVIAQNGLFRRRCLHLDFGSALRRAVSGGEASAFYSSPELDFIHGVLKQGLLLENEHFPLAEKIISLFLVRSGFAQKDILVLNGIPRHAGQARDVERLTDVHALVVLDCSAADVVSRIKNNVGGDRTERIDDSVEMIEKKLRVFWERTAPLIEHYEKLGRRIYRIAVSRNMTPTDACAALSALAAVHPPLALVAEPPQ